MSDNPRVALLYAELHAEDVSALIADACERLEVAGSIRRKSETVGDIELVAQPKITTAAVPDGLWGTSEIHTNLLLERLDELVAQGELLTHPTDPKSGERYAKFLDPRSGMQVDLFMVLPPAQFGVIHLIRTGSAGYSEWFVKAIRAKGYHIKDGALHRGGLGCVAHGCEVVDTPNESDVFRITGMLPTPLHMRDTRLGQGS